MHDRNLTFFAPIRLNVKRGAGIFPGEPMGWRKTHGWEPGTSFIVLGRGNAIILQPLTIPDMSQFDDLVAKSRALARKAGMTTADVRNAVKSVRHAKRAKT